MGRPESFLCVSGEDKTFDAFSSQVPDEIRDEDNQIVPDLTSSQFTMTCQEQLTVIQPMMARRTSYEEIVHSTDPILGSNSGRPALTRLITTLTEWLVILQGVAEDRECDRPNAKCRCLKAEKITDHLRLLATKLSNAEQVCERVGRVSEEDILDISETVHQIAGMLRSEVSILIPTSIGRADPMVVEQARWLALDEGKNCASGAVEGVASLVVRLLGVDSCQSCRTSKGEEDGDVDMDILNLVAGMCSAEPITNHSNETSKQPRTTEEDLQQLKEIKRQVLERSRKRKQTRPVRFPSPPSNRKSRKLEPGPDPLDTTPPSPEEEKNILAILEKKKKGVKKDGLYKFVLWREALKDEKSKLT